MRAEAHRFGLSGGGGGPRALRPAALTCRRRFWASSEVLAEFGKAAPSLKTYSGPPCSRASPPTFTHCARRPHNKGPCIHWTGMRSLQAGPAQQAVFPPHAAACFAATCRLSGR